MRKIVIGGAAALILAAGAVVWLRVLGVAAVETVTMAPGEFRAQAFGTGTVEARVYVEVGTKVTGRVVRLLGDQGDTVRQGDLLAVLDDEELLRQREQATFVRLKAVDSVPLERANLTRARASLEARRAAIAKALASTELARVTFDRYKRLHDRELIARQDLDVRSTELRAAEADLANLRAEAAALEADIQRGEVAIRMAEREVAVAGAALAASESRLRETAVTAPLSGLILSREVEPGVVVVAGVPLFKMVDPRTVWIRIHLDESLLGAIRLGQPAQVTLRSSPGRLFRGEVVRIGEESDRIAEELSVEIRLLEPPPRLRIGEQAEATITTRAAAPAWVVPGSALVDAGSGRSAVFVAEDDRARLRPVTIGARDPRSGAVELTAGIGHGERVVVGPGPFPAALRDGQRLRVAQREPR
jgi:HlyD family secretion protein